VSIPGDLERARHLALAADETSAKELLLSLMPRIEEVDREDLMLEVLAQLGELYLVRTAYEGAVEAVQRIRECLAVYESILDGTASADVLAKTTPMAPADIRHMRCRYTRRAQCLEIGLAAARGDHEGAAAALSALDGMNDGEWNEPAFVDLADEYAYLRTYARIMCAVALCEDDMHVHSVDLWQSVIGDIESTAAATESTDNLLVLGAIGYARFCIETGRLAEAEPWLRRAGARAEVRGWKLATARTRLERATATWSRGQQVATEHLVAEAYPVIAEYARANDVSRCWLYFGLTRMGVGMLAAADDSWEHAERHWRELGRPLHIHRILLQRSWLAILRGRYQEAIDMVEQARACLDESPRSSWLAYARLDFHLGTIWRTDALADLGFDGAGRPDEDWSVIEARFTSSLGVVNADPDSPGFDSAMAKLARAADLKLPAALAVDSVRYSITDAEARAQWADCVSAPMLAGAFTVASEWENTELTGELIEYHSARGTFSAEKRSSGGQERSDRGIDTADVVEWSRVATAPAPISDVDELAEVAAGPVVAARRSLTRLGPLPPLTMDPTGVPVLAEYRALALSRYGQHVTTDEAAWSTWP
jgi:tetratricopeptide (TPR) repeat protein